MRFSLLCATVGRTAEVDNLLRSLTGSRHRDFEVVVADQNPDDRLVPVIASYAERLDVRHVRPPLGLARARNAAWEVATGEVISFADDDCRYDPDLLGWVNHRLATDPDLDVLTGRAVDREQHPTAGRYRTTSGRVHRGNVWTSAVEVSVFVRSSAAKGVRFDETLGLGSGTPWGSGEGTDLLLQLLERGRRIEYDHSLAVLHDPVTDAAPERRLARAYSYGCGMGRVLARHHYPLPQRAWWLARPLGGAALAMARRDAEEARYQWRTLRGRLDGMRG